MGLKNKRKKAGAGVPNFRRGMENIRGWPSGPVGRGMLASWLVAFVYPTNDVVQTSHAEKERKPMRSKLNKMFYHKNRRSCLAVRSP